MTLTIHRWKAGDRVTRQVYMDDGTWERKGDKCLKNSPLKHGEVFKRVPGTSDVIIVRWDNGTEQRLLDHGVEEEIPHDACEAVIHHGPGHQSSTKCQLHGKHKIHYAVYGRYDQEARWKGKSVFSGFFDEPPPEPKE